MFHRGNIVRIESVASGQLIYSEYKIKQNALHTQNIKCT